MDKTINEQAGSVLQSYVSEVDGTPAALIPREPVARLARVSKRFGPVTALADVSLEVARGRVLGVIGRSGAGKSTLIRLLNGLERPDAGSVYFEGQDLTRLGERALQPVCQRIGMIFQHFNLLSSKTVAANVALPLRIAGVKQPGRARRLAELLDLVGLSEKAQATRAEVRNDPRIAKLIAVYRSPEVKQFILDRFGGTIIPTW